MRRDGSGGRAAAQPDPKEHADAWRSCSGRQPPLGVPPPGSHRTTLHGPARPRENSHYARRASRPITASPMNSGFEFVPTAAGLSFAAAAVAIGAPLFSDGLRAIRLARAFRALEPSSIADAASGLAHVHGQVTLESPMFSPLGGIACAGYRLELS